MRKKHWTLTPWFIIFAAVMLLMAFVSFEYNIVLCYIELGISVAAIAVVFVISLRFRSYINNTVKAAAEKIKGLNPEYLEKYKYPVAVSGSRGDILWCNARFRKAICCWVYPFLIRSSFNRLQ